jgi:hypothetical protein
MAVGQPRPERQQELRPLLTECDGPLFVAVFGEIFPLNEGCCRLIVLDRCGDLSGALELLARFPGLHELAHISGAGGVGIEAVAAGAGEDIARIRPTGELRFENLAQFADALAQVGG